MIFECTIFGKLKCAKSEIQLKFEIWIVVIRIVEIGNLKFETCQLRFGNWKLCFDNLNVRIGIWKLKIDIWIIGIWKLKIGWNLGATSASRSLPRLVQSSSQWKKLGQGYGSICGACVSAVKDVEPERCFYDTLRITNVCIYIYVCAYTYTYIYIIYILCENIQVSRVRFESRSLSSLL